MLLDLPRHLRQIHLDQPDQLNLDDHSIHRRHHRHRKPETQKYLRLIQHHHSQQSHYCSLSLLLVQRHQHRFARREARFYAIEHPMNARAFANDGGHTNRRCSWVFQ